MWDSIPVLYWRCRVNGKMTWRKANAAYLPDRKLWAIEPPMPPEVKVNESGDESE